LLLWAGTLVKWGNIRGENRVPKKNKRGSFATAKKGGGGELGWPRLGGDSQETKFPNWSGPRDERG